MSQDATRHVLDNSLNEAAAIEGIETKNASQDTVIEAHATAIYELSNENFLKDASLNGTALTFRAQAVMNHTACTILMLSNTKNGKMWETPTFMQL